MVNGEDDKGSIMSDIAILVNHVEAAGDAAVVLGFVTVRGQAGVVNFSAPVPYDGLSQTQNNLIRDAAIAAVIAAGHAVGELDTKTIYGGAVGL